MAALTITPSQVQPGSVAAFLTGTAGETITAGQAVYLDPITHTFKLARCDATAPEAACVGLAMQGVSLGQRLSVQRDGDLLLGAGAAPAVGQVYCVGATPGSLVPYADVASGQFVTLVGVGKTGNLLAMAVCVSGQLHT